MLSASFLDLGDDEPKTDSSGLQELSHRDPQTGTSYSLTKFAFNFLFHYRSVLYTEGAVLNSEALSVLHPAVL